MSHGHAKKGLYVLIVKGNGTGNFGVPKVDEKRLKNGYGAICFSCWKLNILHSSRIRVVLAMSSPYIDHWNGVKDIGLMLKETSALKRL